MGFKKVAELVIQGVEDRLTVSSILIKNGYTVGQTSESVHLLERHWTIF